jgi:nicotinate-nucleotide--dimethylbenzimidazole phosphoribosyltransferase
VNALDATCARIAPPNEAIATQTQLLLDDKTKPRRSLGRLEELACRVAAIRGVVRPQVGAKCIVVMGADHGIAEEGVSAYPAAVTRQMLLNFATGGAAINALARHVGADVVVVDMGVREALPAGCGVEERRIAAGTANFARGPAMSRDEAVRAVEAGIEVAQRAIDGGAILLGLGEMGIGNTAAASALTAVLTGCPVGEVTGRGTGIDDAGLVRKISAIEQGLEVNRPDAGDPLGVLAQVGGFEIAGLAGVTLAGAAARVPVVVDGFIAGAAALVATRLAPAARGCLIAAHRSVERGHGRVLEDLRLEPLLDLRMRLGEGTGAALAMGLIDAALRILAEMASFAAAGVSDSGA